jgi:hypothetical protein
LIPYDSGINTGIFHDWWNKAEPAHDPLVLDFIANLEYIDRLTFSDRNPVTLISTEPMQTLNLKNQSCPDYSVQGQINVNGV